MKRIIRYTAYCLSLLSMGTALNSCNYLDIVPEEQEKESDAYADEPAARRYLSSCYGFLPNPRSGSESLDFMTGDEVVTAFEHEKFASFPKGNFTATNPVISYWNTLFSGIRQCYMFIDDLNDESKFPGLSKEDRTDFKAQSTFLIAYYHYLLSRCYGPILLIKETPDLLTPPSEYLARSPYDECVDWICGKFQEAIDLGLKTERPVDQFGLATSVAAKALIAKLRLFAASPLYNGNTDFKDFVDKAGTPLMAAEFSQQKWDVAMKAYKEAIDLATSEGFTLYTKTDAEKTTNSEPSDPIQRRLRYVIMDYSDKTLNPEVIWADTRNEGQYDVQNKSIPYCSGASAWNGVAPTLTMVKRFYTKNGLPIDEDPEFIKSDQYFNIVTVDKTHADEAAEGSETFELNLNREPRYYAWIAFQGGFYETLSAVTNGAYSNDPLYKKWSDVKKGNRGKMECNFVLGGNVSRGSVNQPRSSNYSPSGFLNKKGVSPTRAKTKSSQGPTQYPWPIIRLADLYLGYAEACVECGQLDEAKKYLNKVRERAGIPDVEVSWAKVPGVVLNKEKLRQIVRQERMNEFYLENQNFWDLRRWKLAEKYFNVKAHGMNIMATTLKDFCVDTQIDFERKFTAPTQYLLPIPQSDINKDEKLVNNPGY